MRKLGKIITIIIIFTISFCHISFAAKLGEKNAGGVVVAIHKNKEYVAIGVTSSALSEGEVLAWSKWSSQDLITIYNRCARGSLRYWNQEYEKYTWYVNFQKEFSKRQERKEIIAIGSTTSTLTAFDSDGNPQYEDDVEFRIASDMTEEDKDKAEEYDKQNEYKKYKANEIVEYLEEHGYVCPTNCYEKWEQTLRNAIETKSKDTQIYKKYVNVYEKTFGAYETADGDTAIYKAPTKQEKADSGELLGEIVSDADSFMAQADKLMYNEGKVQNISSTIFNTFLIIGIALAIIAGVVIGITYMMGSVGERADYKQLLLPYIIGCFVLFSGFSIWKMIISILENII